MCSWGDCTGHTSIEVILPTPPPGFQSPLPFHKLFLLPSLLFPWPAPSHASGCKCHLLKEAFLDFSSSESIPSAQPLYSSLSMFFPSPPHQVEMSCICVQDLFPSLNCELWEGRNRVGVVPPWLLQHLARSRHSGNIF